MAQLLLQGLTSNFHPRDYYNVYADKVVNLNSEFVAAFSFKERLKDSKNLIARQQIVRANTLHHSPEEPLDILQVSLVNAQILKRLFSNASSAKKNGGGSKAADIYGLNFYRP